MAWQSSYEQRHRNHQSGSNNAIVDDTKEVIERMPSPSMGDNCWDEQSDYNREQQPSWSNAQIARQSGVDAPNGDQGQDRLPARLRPVQVFKRRHRPMLSSLPGASTLTWADLASIQKRDCR